jgi:sec-independent protein translocase protein TatA
MPNIGPFELVIVAFILLLMFGAKRIPEIARSLGTGMREFKEGITTGGEAPAPTELSRPAGTAPAETSPARETRRD